MPPLISVVVPAFNRAATVNRTIRSVLRAADHLCDARGLQSCDGAELVIVDDGSTDDTASIASRLIDTEPRARVVTQANAGVSAARNTGARAAAGAHLLFVDCDDVIMTQSLLRYADAFDTGVDLVFGSARSIGAGLQEIWRPKPLGPAFFEVVGLFNPGMFAVERSAFDAVGGYAVPLTFSENTELGLRLSRHLHDKHGSVRTHIVDEVLIEIGLPDTDAGSNAYSDRSRLESALYLVDVHGAVLAKSDPALLSTYWAVAGVAAARLGRARMAQGCFLEAARIAPHRSLHLARAAVSFVGPLRRRRWPARAQNRNL